MELAGTAYLLNLSLVAMTFATVSVLVMVMRQTMGGKLSNFDIFLTSLYISLGFTAAMNAILPVLVGMVGLAEATTWIIASLVAAAIQTIMAFHIQRERPRAAQVKMPGTAIFAYIVHWTAAALFVLNAALPVLQGPALHAFAITLSLGMAMWTFVRRISLLIGDKPGEDWDAGKA